MDRRKQHDAAPAARPAAGRSRRFRVLDLFCGAGGASRGYADAGFDVTGVDIADRPNYPYEFVRADALTVDARGYDLVHASPPFGDADLLARTRDVLRAAGVEYVIEGDLHSAMQVPMMLCGTMFGLRVYRHRLFESSLMLFMQNHPPHRVRCAVVGMERKTPGLFRCVAGHFADAPGAAEAMGIDWRMTRDELAQAVPPAYSAYIGRQIKNQLVNLRRMSR